MNKLEKLIDAGYKVKIQSSSKFCLTLDDETPCMSFNSDSIEEAIDSAYDFVKEKKKVANKTETEEKITDYKIIIDVPQKQELKIDEDMLNGEFKTTTTIRLYSEVWEQFKDFTQTYKDYKSMDLVSMALLEYIEKYKE
ncbi:hypothetical protein LGL55_13445 [Clostridium tagluense]|uniref:hypothetical protein n=1 Tax=Clostridium TaxID=1485 RepID=UPI0013E97E2A|nr:MULTISPECIES: hypothetical protein [Clostridium]MBW9155472.1 hypothetical protein [Clostridium tagluense]MBZ9621784.1 hypothetical protein [Clostridium sp. FP2]MCB2298911.1 hypothetical protein [Clostridium tagluense]MCB2312292.1 hypothetical protein [Clostridium tagluense]MCB2316970.1 hypothetical protein [Clostridium tagluense]